MQLKKLLLKDSHWAINKCLAKKIGLEATVLLQHLIDLQDSFFKNGNFYQQMDRLIEDLPLSEHKIRNAIKILTNYNFIKVEKKGMPAKYFYILNDVEIINFLTTSSSKIEPQDVQKVNHKRFKNLTSSSSKSEPKLFKNLTTSSSKSEPLVVQKVNHKRFKNLTTNTKNLDTKNLNSKNRKTQKIEDTKNLATRDKALKTNFFNLINENDIDDWKVKALLLDLNKI